MKATHVGAFGNAAVRHAPEVVEHPLRGVLKFLHLRGVMILPG